MQKVSKNLIFLIVACALCAASMLFFGLSLSLRGNISLSANETTDNINGDEVPDDETTAYAGDQPSSDIVSPSDAEDGDTAIRPNMRLKVKPISQLPELPNGCEIVALATVLQYLGFDVDKNELSRDYLPCGPVGKVAPDTHYVGDPTSDRTGTAFGCLAPVITRSANQFFEDNDAAYYAVNLTGTPLEELCEYVADGIPIIVWTTLEMKESPTAATWYIDGTRYSWLSYSHCTVLSGYTRNVYFFADPLYGVVSYTKEMVEAAYKAQYLQAVAIFEKP